MKISQILTEIYSQSNSYLKRYLRDKEFDPYENWWYVAKWIVEDFGLEEFNELVGENFDEDDIEEADPELFNKLSDEDQKACAEWAYERITSNGFSQDELPSHQHMDYQKQIPRNSWLVHFTNFGRDISEEGFKSDEYDVNTVAHTKAQSSPSVLAGKEGYCFAFNSTNRRDIRNTRYARKYGTDVVMFQNSGVEAYHYGDEETQIIFTASDVDPRKIIWIHKFDDEFYVMRKGSRYIEDAVFHDEDLMKVIEWVKLHHQQYRNIIMK